MHQREPAAIERDQLGAAAEAVGGDRRRRFAHEPRMIIEDARASQPESLLADLNRMRSASVQLNAFVKSLIQNSSADRQEDETLMLTGDLNAASVEWTVQWRVTEPAQYLFRFPLNKNDQFAEDLITFVARTVMNRLVGDYSFDEVIGPKRSHIANEARNDTQRILDAYACGITITALQMQRVIPPDRVKPAFDKVNASIQQKQKLENEAESERNKLLPEAKAARDKLIREAEGYASRRRAEALLAKYHAYQRAPEITRQRLYIEAMQDLLQSVKNKTIIDADLKQFLPLLNLDSKGESYP
jgi:membrane protease subunit HflK